MSQKAITPLSVVVVGGGIGGFVASILLAQYGHHVIVLERRDSDYEGRSTGGISLTYNSWRILEHMGLKDKIEAITDPVYPVRMKYDTLEITAKVEYKYPYYMLHRADLSKILVEHAYSIGVNIHFLSRIASIEDSQDHVIVKLEDGSEFKPDLLVGVDGISSQVRQTIFPDVSPQLTPCTVMLVSIPQSVMESDPKTAELYKTPGFHSPWAPGRSIVSWTMSRRQVYHLQLCDFEYFNGEPYSFYDPPDAPLVQMLDDPKSLLALQKRWADFAPQIQSICKFTTSYTKWKIAEMPALDSFSSPSGRIVLVGDAAHAIKPFAGQGANMAIEDGQVLATLLSLIASKNEIRHVMSLYDKIRLPRLAKLRKIIELNVKIFSMRDREEHVAETQSEDERKKAEMRKAARAEVMKEYGPAPANVWLTSYDADAEARKAWAEFVTTKGVDAKI